MEDRVVSINIKMAKAKQLLADVGILQKHGGYNSIISRLYYACYHATTALRLTKKLQAKTHKGLAALLYTEFVSKGEFELTQSAFFARLMQERMDEDYGDFLVADHETIQEFLEPAKGYIDYIERLIALYYEQQ
jgi:uncharacterized protein (UPF0332 family)